MSPDAYPPPVDRAAWERVRAELLVKEKAHTRAGDRIAADRRRLPMVPIANYAFDGPEGDVNLLDLFGDQPQLVVQNFMFDPEWDEGCPSCSSLADDVTHLGHLGAFDLAYARISRAPIEKLVAYNERMGWSAPWVSSLHTTYNQDFGWTKDDGEYPGVSVYLRRDDDIFQTYVTSGRGVEVLSGLSGYADIAPYGRQEDWEDSPAGWPQHPTYEGALRRHDQYD